MLGCKSAFYDKNRKKTNIALFTVNKREDLRKKWLNVLNHVHRKRGADSFEVKNPNKRIYECEFHFKNEDLTIRSKLVILTVQKSCHI